jgi:hypothetical protein
LARSGNTLFAAANVSDRKLGYLAVINLTNFSVEDTYELGIHDVHTICIDPRQNTLYAVDTAHDTLVWYSLGNPAASAE